MKHEAPLADEVMATAKQRTHDEGERLWTPRHHEIIREEWHKAYGECDEQTWESLGGRP